jgi:hypothetical protein
LRTVILVALVGCVEPFHGSNVQLDLSPIWPAQASPGVAPRATEVPDDVHFTLYAFQNDGTVGRLFEVQRFEVHHIVDPLSPCFIDVGAHVPFPGLHVTQYAALIEQQTGISDPANPPAGATQQQKIDVATALQRELNVAALASDQGIKVVSSASDYNYDAMAVDCTSPGFPPPMCTDTASNARRLQMCQDFWKKDPNYFEGTDRVLTAPLDGVTHGMVDGLDPINLGPVGGASLYVDTDLGGFTDYAIYMQQDGVATDPGTLLVFGTATMDTRGVMHVKMAGSGTPLTAEVAIFANLDEDNTTF